MEAHICAPEDILFATAANCPSNRHYNLETNSNICRNGALYRSFLTLHGNRGDSHKRNVEWKKSNAVEFILRDSTHTERKYRRSGISGLQDRMVVTIVGGLVTRRRYKGSLWGVDNVLLFFYLGTAYRGVFGLWKHDKRYSECVCASSYVSQTSIKSETKKKKDLNSGTLYILAFL